jgi:hypothetical protein
MELFQKPKNVVSRWFSFENRHGSKSQGGKENKGPKGHPSDVLEPGETFALMDAKGPGVVRRIWLTVDAYESPRMLRSLQIDMYWDGSKKPAVSAPLGDFLALGWGER